MYRLRAGKKKSWSIIIDGMDQAKLRLPHLVRTTHALSNKRQISMKLTGVLAAGAPIPCFAYINSEHYSGSSNLTVTVLMDVLRRLAAKVRQIAAERKENGEDPALDPALQRKLNDQAKRIENFSEVLKRMGITTVQQPSTCEEADTRACEEPSMGADVGDDDDSDDEAEVEKNPQCATNKFKKATQPLDVDAYLEKAMAEILAERRNRIKIDLAKENVSIWPSRLYLQLDNTSRDNKNSIVFLFLAMLVYYGVFDVVTCTERFVHNVIL
jgi:hypothetical protein